MVGVTTLEYKPKSAAIFVGKDYGWEVFDESIKPNVPFPTVSDSWSNGNSTLYLSIASFRDTLCPYTLFHAYSKAKYPQRLTVGVVQQNAQGDVDCLDRYCELMAETGKYDGADCPFEDNIRMMRVDSSTAKGPTWGRAKASTLLRDEEFCMQTDAHMDFVPNWDVKMLKMWASTNNEYAVLSTYVAASTQLEYNLKDDSMGLGNTNEVPHLCMVTLDGSNGLVRIWGTKCARNLPRPKMTNAVWGAGLSFSKCHAERKAPYDPHTPFIFDGEEFSRAVRFWTWGYDIYTPHRVYVVHNYAISQSDPNHFDWYRSKTDPAEGTLEQSVFRLKTLLEIRGGSTDPAYTLQMHQSKYGLGDRRTLDQAIAFSGIDTKNHRILGNRCGNIDYVPFKEHPFGVNYIPPFDPVNEAFIGTRDPGSIYYNESSVEMKRKWEDAIAERQRSDQRILLRNLKGASKTGVRTDVRTIRELAAARANMGGLNSVAHIVDVSFGDGYGLHSQNEPDGSLIMVFLVAFIGICINMFCCRRCYSGKTPHTADENNIFTKTV